MPRLRSSYCTYTGAIFYVASKQQTFGVHLALRCVLHRHSDCVTECHPLLDIPFVSSLRIGFVELKGKFVVNSIARGLDLEIRENSAPSSITPCDTELFQISNSSRNVGTLSQRKMSGRRTYRPGGFQSSRILI